MEDAFMVLAFIGLASEMFICIISMIKVWLIDGDCKKCSKCKYYKSKEKE